MKSKELWKVMQQVDLTFFTGVPDSTFKSWMMFLEEEHGGQLTNIIASNECEAVAIAIGYHLATNKVAVAYMQNAGEGKTVNPLTSLCDPEIYSIPLLLMIGWRGEPGKKDEPQHFRMGQITLSLLDLMRIPHEFLPQNANEAKITIENLVTTARRYKRPVALIVKQEVIEDDLNPLTKEIGLELYREEIIQIIAGHLTDSTAIVSTTGKTSRELFEYRIDQNENPRDFYTIGGMGCASAIALGVSLSQSKRKVVILDGDGALLMQLGSLATIGHYAPNSLYHILLDNQSHDSTGGQPTVSPTVDFEKIAKACGYLSAQTVSTKKELIMSLSPFFSMQGPVMLIIEVKKGSRTNLRRPTTTPLQNKQAFMTFLQK